MSQLSHFLASEDDGLFFVGHASILVRLSGKKFLFDPVFNESPYGDSWLFFPPQVIDERLLDVDAVFVSHCHKDHFDPQFLKRLKPEIPIFIIGGRPVFEKMFANEGLKATVLAPGFRHDLLCGEKISAWGVLHEHNTIDASLVIRNGNLSVYHGNDNFVSKEVLTPLREAAGFVDIACVPFSFIHWYPFLLEGVDPAWKEAEGKRLIEKYLDLGIEQAEALQPRVVIPFGANLVYHDDPDSVMNQAVLSPIDFAEYAKKDVCESLGEKYDAFFSGDYFLKNGHLLLRFQAPSKSKEHFKADLKKFLAEKKLSDPDRLFIPPAVNTNLRWLEERIKFRTSPTNHRIYVQGEGEGWFIEIDLTDFGVAFIFNDHKYAPYHSFTVQLPVLYKWLAKEISFEEVIGTRRFTVERKPNSYNLQVLEFINNVL